MSNKPLCGVAWGSHACDHPRGHVEQNKTLHRCSDCCNSMIEAHGDDHAVAHMEATEDQYGADGCAGLWPYYGRKSMVTEASLPFWKFDDNNHVVVLTEEFDKMKALHDIEVGNA